jgi:uncharacterized protein
MIIDAFTFARNAQSAAGQIPVASLRRLDLVDHEGSLDWALKGYVGSQHRLFLRLEVSGTLHVRCQRCLDRMDWPVDIKSTVWLASSDADADRLPLDEDEFDPVVGSEAFDVDALIEDEVLLALPPTPKHLRCPEPLQVKPDLAASPFAALRGMKRDD